MRVAQEVVDRVEHQHERVVVTRNGRAAAVLISPDDLEALEETLSVLHDTAALSDIREADAAHARARAVAVAGCLPTTSVREPRGVIVLAIDHYRSG